MNWSIDITVTFWDLLLLLGLLALYTGFGISIGRDIGRAN